LTLIDLPKFRYNKIQDHFKHLRGFFGLNGCISRLKRAAELAPALYFFWCKLVQFTASHSKSREQKAQTQKQPVLRPDFIWATEGGKAKG
jgi:hypothetical protein